MLSKPTNRAIWEFKTHSVVNQEIAKLFHQLTSIYPINGFNMSS